MLIQSIPIIPPAPKVHVKDLLALRHLLTAQRNGIEILPDYALDGEVGAPGSPSRLAN
jgi:hypothetical protein